MTFRYPGNLCPRCNRHWCLKRKLDKAAACDAGFDLLHTTLDRTVRVVLVPSVHSLEPATVDRDHGLGEQVQPSAKHYELAAGRPDRGPVVLAEIGNGLEIRHEASGQPHQFDVTLGLPLQAPARRDAVEIAVEIDLQ